MDLALFALKSPLCGNRVHEILRDEIERRKLRGTVLEIPAEFRVPDVQSWTGGYSKAAQNVGELPSELRTLDGVHPIVDAFITPLLRSEPPTGQWHPDEPVWR